MNKNFVPGRTVPRSKEDYRQLWNICNGSGINEAIENGYTHITITGICKEKLLFNTWNTNNLGDKIAPRYIKLKEQIQIQK